MVRDLTLPSDLNDDFWHGEDLSRMRAMKSRRDLFKDRLSYAIRRLREDDVLQVRDDGEFALAS